MRLKVLSMLENAKRDGTPFLEALQAYDEPFTMVGFQRALTGVPPEFATALFHWGRAQTGYVLKPRLLYCVMGALRRGKLLEEEGPKLIRDMGGDVEGERVAYSALYYNLIFAEEDEKAQKVMDEMVRNGIDPHGSLFGRLLDLTCEREGLDASMELYSQHMSKGWVSDADGLIPLLTRLCSKGRVSEAFKVYEETRKKGVEHQENIHQTLVNGLTKANKLDEAYKVAESIISRGTKSKDTPFKALVNKLVAARKYDEAIVVYKDLVRLNCVVSGVHLVGALSRAEELNKGLELVEAIGGGTVELVDMKELMMELCKAGRVEDARGVFDKMVAAGAKPDAQTCIALAQCISSGKVDGKSDGKMDGNIDSSGNVDSKIDSSSISGGGEMDSKSDASSSETESISDDERSTS